jgi:hypothetical protein
VRREDLDDSDGSSDIGSEDGADIQARLEAQMAQSLGLDLTNSENRATVLQKSVPRDNAVSPAQVRVKSSDTDDSSAGEEEDNADENPEVQDDGREEYDFCLFGGAGAAASTKVVLEDDSAPAGEGGIRTERPRSFYLATKASPDEKQQYEFAAVTGDQVLEMSRLRWWGMEYPWRVTHITTALTETKKGGGENGVTDSKDGQQGTETKRRRPGKKRRIAMRNKERVKKSKAEVAAKKAEEKEEHIKEKKKRLNRLKKLRKRAKNKEQKLAQGGGEGGGESDGGDSSDG